jgi:hypothetical protein
MTIFFLKEGVAHAFDPANISPGLICCFNPKTTLYFFEPGGILNTQPLYEDIDITTFATTSHIDRYKGFCKVGDEVHMPPFRLDELVDIGKYISKHEDFQNAPDDLKFLYNEGSIRERFSRYSGIIRHVLPTSVHGLALELQRNTHHAVVYYPRLDKNGGYDFFAPQIYPGQ